MGAHITSTEPVMRLIKHAGWTRARFQEEFGLGANRMTWQGQGRFNDIADAILASLRAMLRDQGRTLEQASLELFGTLNVQEAYHTWRRQKRQENAQHLPSKTRFAELGGTPIQRLVEAVGGVSTLSRLLCVNEYTVRRYWQGITRELPSDIKEALSHSGWPLGPQFVAACATVDADRIPAGPRPGRRQTGE